MVKLTSQTFFRLLAGVAVTSLLLACGRSADTNRNGSAAGAEPAPIASTDVVKVNPEELTLSKGETGTAIVRLQIQSGYHVNANPASFAYLRATALEITPAGGVSVDFITYPDPLTKTLSFSPDALKVYEGETIVKATLKAGPTAEPGKHNLSAKLSVQACDDQVCYAPGTINLTVPVTIK